MLNAANSLFLIGLEGISLRQKELSIFKKMSPSGVILFSRNIPQDDYPKVQFLINELQKIANKVSTLPFIISVDQEGGRVSRLPSPFPNQGSAMFLENQKIDAVALNNIKAYGYQVGINLKNLGFNLNFAPVCDVLSNKNNKAIGDRSFSNNTQHALVRAKAFLEGLQEAHVYGCLKHFPGQGAALEDTHEGSAIITDDYDTLYKRDIIVFEKLIPLTDFIMISHCIYTSLDKNNPASLSSVIIEDLLRKKLKFSKIVVSDDMNMRAIEQDEKIWVEKIIQSIWAGVNLVLICKDIDRYVLAVEAIRKEMKKNKNFENKILQSYQLISQFRNNLKLIK